MTAPSTARLRLGRHRPPASSAAQGKSCVASWPTTQRRPVIILRRRVHHHHVLAGPDRLVILQHLSRGEHRVVDLTRHLGLAQSTVSKHLACLRDCGLVSSRPQGRASVFGLTHPEALMDLLAAAERLSGLTGDAVTLCPTYGAATLEEADR